MFSRRPGFRFNRGRVSAQGGAFIPSQLSGLQLWVRSDAESDVSYETGTSPDIRRVDSITNRGALGGTLAQGTSANKPVNASFPEGRAAFFDGSNDRLVSSLAATNFKFLHDGTGATVFTVYRTPDISSAAQALVATETVLASDIGVVLRTRTDGGMRLSISDGTSLDNFNTAAGVAQSNATHVTCLRHSATETDVIDIRLDGTQVANATSYPTITPSSADPSNTLVVGSRSDNGDPFSGYLPEVIIYDRYLTDAECAQVEAYLARWTMAVTYAELQTAAVADLYELDAFLHSTGSAWVDALGNHTVTEVATPTHGTSASFNGKNVMTLNGSTQYAHFDTLASQFDGNDTPITLLSCHELDDVLATYKFLELSFPDAGGDHEHGLASTAVPEYRTRRDDGPTAATVSAGTATAGAEIVASAFRQTSGAGAVSMYLDAAKVTSESALDVTAVTLTTAATGAQKGTVVGNFTPGDFACQLVSKRFLNHGDYLAIHYALATEFGL